MSGLSDDYFRGYDDGIKQAKHDFSQWILNTQRELDTNQLRIALDTKQKELSGRKL